MSETPYTNNDLEMMLKREIEKRRTVEHERDVANHCLFQMQEAAKGLAGELKEILEIAGYSCPLCMKIRHKIEGIPTLSGEQGRGHEK